MSEESSKADVTPSLPSKMKWPEFSPSPILDIDHARTHPRSPKDTVPTAFIDLGSIPSTVMLASIVRLTVDIQVLSALCQILTSQLVFHSVNC